MITVSLETAKKLKEAGRKKQTHFVHKELRDIKYSGAKGIHYIHTMLPTAQEILDELPNMIGECILTVNKIYIIINDTVCSYGSGYMDRNRKGLHNERSLAHCGINLAESLAKLRLRCKENNHLT